MPEDGATAERAFGAVVTRLAVGAVTTAAPKLVHGLCCEGADAIAICACPWTKPGGMGCGGSVIGHEGTVIVEACAGAAPAGAGVACWTGAGVDTVGTWCWKKPTT